MEALRAMMNPQSAYGRLASISDPIVKSYWKDQISQTGGFTREPGILDYFVSKLSRFCACPPIRRIVGQSRSGFNLRQIMDERKVLVVKLSRGNLGPENSNFLGILLLSKILLAVLSRGDIPEAERYPVSLFVDEAHLFATPLLAHLLTEGRKYGLSMILANQHLGQWRSGVRETIMGNVGTVISFRAGVEDAHPVSALFPDLGYRDLMELPAFRAYVRLQLGAEGTRLVEVETPPPPDTGRPDVAEQIARRSRELYGRPRQEVDREIEQRWDRAIGEDDEVVDDLESMLEE